MNFAVSQLADCLSLPKFEKMNENLLQEFQKLFDVVHELRVKCPWDREQTNESLRHLTIEEVYELSDAILQNDDQEIKVELGDLLLHVLFYARIGEEKEAFSTTEMMTSLREKLIRRHPHIYGDVQVGDSKQVIENWEKIKLKEKGKKKKKVLDGVPKGLPSLIKAMRVQEKVRNVGFDWEEDEQVWEKVQEELGEFYEVANEKNGGERDMERMEDEFGDVLFSLVNYARFLGINPEDALEKTNRKFIRRFEYLEEKAGDAGLELSDMTLAEMDVFWEEAKKMEG